MEGLILFKVALYRLTGRSSGQRTQKSTSNGIPSGRRSDEAYFLVGSTSYFSSMRL